MRTGEEEKVEDDQENMRGCGMNVEGVHGCGRSRISVWICMVGKMRKNTSSQCGGDVEAIKMFMEIVPFVHCASHNE